jgi:hypothetical protein
MVHNVFFWLKPDSDPATFESAAKALLEIDLVRGGSVGKSAATPERSVNDKSFSYHLAIDFDSVADHDAYQTHPEHNRFVNACKDLWDRVVVYDSESV